MQIIHELAKQRIQKKGSGESFLIANYSGNYLYLDSSPKSRYQGFFLYNDHKMFKVIENIEVKPKKIAQIKNSFYQVSRKRGPATETFFVPKERNSLVYELNKKSSIVLSFDCKESYDNRVWGRNYYVYTENDCFIVEFVKRTDSREDATHDEHEYTLYTAIKTDGTDVKEVNEWVEHTYAIDTQRGSVPDSRFVFKGLTVKGKKVVMSCSFDKETAIAEAKEVFEKTHLLKKEQKEFSNKLLSNSSLKLKNIKDKNIRFAYASAVHSLTGLTVTEKNQYAVLAGLPWFYQIWSRDELISLKAFMLLKQYDIVIDSVKRNATLIHDGILMNNLSGNVPSADGLGWLFYRLGDLSKKSDISKYVPISRLKQIVGNVTTKQTLDSFAVNKEKETWMDSLDRAGIRIEIQALRLALYSFMEKKTGVKVYKYLEEKLRAVVHKEFFQEGFLYDGLHDKTIRPNVFLVYYLYPKLLSKKEWEECFGILIKKLWLPYGGFSTIDKKDARFVKNHSGENAKSYHNGDSWYWINNLAALCLHKLNKKKFKKEIKAIATASASEILWSGAIGNHSEISSAGKLESKGAISQAWSAALFIELVHELY